MTDLRERYADARERRSPLVGGHRGNSAELPENTLTAFRSALQLGVDILECDIHMSADGELVVMHDATLDRTTNGSGPVRERTLAELRELDAGHGERVPTLAELCDVVEDGNGVGLCVEVKQPEVPYTGIERRLVELVRARGLVERTLVISFHHPTVGRVKELEPALLTGALLNRRSEDPVGVLRGCGADLYAPHFLAMDPDVTAAVHRAGAFVGCWTVDDADGAEWCRTCGPDSVFTNRPRELMPLLR